MVTTALADGLAPSTDTPLQSLNMHKASVVGIANFFMFLYSQKELQTPLGKTKKNQLHWLNLQTHHNLANNTKFLSQYILNAEGQFTGHDINLLMLVLYQVLIANGVGNGFFQYSESHRLNQSKPRASVH